MKTLTSVCALIVLAGFAIGGCAQAQPDHACEKDQKRIAANLANFDDLDFNVYSGQKWNELSRSHSKDIVVHWPDGRTTKGIDVHIQDLKAMFVWAPDTRIEVHPVKVAQGEWTAVMGVIEGTFSRPMPIGNDEFIQPTGKSFKLTMSTFGHWDGDGTMDEEYLFWDNQEFMRQIGLGK